MTTRTLFALSAVCLSLIVYGTSAMQGWAVTAGLVGMVGTSFLFAIKTDDPDRTIHEILADDLESSEHDDEASAALQDALA